MGDSCTAVVDFRVDGKPNPPPCPLKATINKLVDAKANFKYSIVFTDTSGTITDDPTLPSTPGSHWTDRAFGPHPHLLSTLSCELLSWPRAREGEETRECGGCR